MDPALATLWQPNAEPLILAAQRFDLDALPPTSSSSVGAFAPLLAEAVVTLGEHGWRPCFVIVFDEAFRLVEELSMALAAVVGGDPIVPIWDFFA